MGKTKPLQQTFDYMLNTLINILSYHTWSGNEAIMRPYLLSELRRLNFTVAVDNVGNIYAHRGISNAYPLFNAHMDIVYNLDYKVRNKLSNKTNKVVALPAAQNCMNCAFLESCIDMAMTTYEITEKKAYYKMKYAQGCDSWEEDVHNYNKKIKEQMEQKTWWERYNHLDDYDYSTHRMYSYGTYTYSYTPTTKEEKRNADELLTEMFKIKYDEKEMKIKSSEERVLGGDDKCGIALTLAIANMLPDMPMKILFTVEEEIGCNGIEAFCKTNSNWFKDVKYSITIDRKGSDNLLQYSAGGRNCSNSFAAQLALHGILCGIPVKVEHGTIADVVHIRKHVKETVNISAGYYSPHSTSEWIDFGAMCKILEWLKRIVLYTKV